MQRQVFAICLATLTSIGIMGEACAHGLSIEDRDTGIERSVSQLANDSSQFKQPPATDSKQVELRKLADLLRAQGSFPEELVIRKQLLDIAEEISGSGHGVILEELSSLALSYQENYQYRPAEQMFMHALSIAEKDLNNDPKKTAKILCDLAGVYLLQGKFGQARPLLERALDLSEKTLPIDYVTLWGSLTAVASMHASMRDFDQAEQVTLRALEIAENHVGTFSQNALESMGRLAEIYSDMNQLDRSLQMASRADFMAELFLGADNKITIERKTALASAFEKVGEFEKALVLFERLLESNVKALGADHPSVAKNLENLAFLYGSMGQHDSAIPMATRALSIVEKKYGVGHPLTHLSVFKLAGANQRADHFASALDLSKKALSIAEKYFDSTHLAYNASVTQLASAYQSVGLHERALPLLKTNLEFNERYYGSSSSILSYALNQLASHHMMQKQYELALPLLERSAKLISADRHPDRFASFFATSNLAFLAEKDGQYSYAEQFLEAALLYAKQIGELSQLAVATTQIRLALAYKINNKLELAGKLIVEAQRNAYSIVEPGTLIAVNANLTDFYAESNPELAIWYGKQAVNAAQAVRQINVTLDKNLNTSLLNSYKHIYERLANLLIKTGRFGEAEQVLTMLKEREIGELIRGAANQVQRTRADYLGVEKDVLTEQQHLLPMSVSEAAELAALEKRIDRDHPLNEADEARRHVLLKSAETWRAEFERFLSSLGKTFDASARSYITQGVKDQTSRLQSKVALDPFGAVGLHYVVTDDRISIIVATPRASFGRFSQVSHEELNKHIGALRRAIVDKSDTRPAAQALWRLLISPVVADIEASGARTLILSLTDSLRYLPFAALQDEDGSYLIEKYAVGLWAAAADVNPRENSKTWQVAALGMTKSQPGFSALPAVRKELEGIVRGTGRKNGVLFGSIAMDEQFGRKQLESSLNGKVNVVHIASHFDFRPGDESRSVLLMGDGGQLSLGQLAEMNFSRVEQLTLSACDTATGGGINENGAEVEGLAAAVLRQNAKSVLATLWKVADESTAALMRGFYVQRNQRVPPSKAQALRKAQLSLLQGETQGSSQTTRAAKVVDSDGSAASGATEVDPSRPWAHPYYWAPFIISGSWL